MKSVNKIILVGRIGASPLRRETKTGKGVCHFPLATHRRVRVKDQITMEEERDLSMESGQGDRVEPVNKNTEYGEETQWHQVVVWGKQGEACFRSLQKGQPVFVEGSVRSRKYEAKDGTEKLSFEVIAENVNFLGYSTVRKAIEDTARVSIPVV